MKSLVVFAASILFSSLLIGQSPDCNTINVTTGSGSIIVSGVNAAPIVGVQVFNSSWASVFSQTYTSHGDVITVSPIPAGQYYVNVRFYNSNWGSICEKVSNVTVSNNPPPPQDTCSVTFQKTYGNAGGDEWPTDFVKSSDGGYVAAGLATANGNTNHDALLMKFDSRGNLLWSKTFGGGQEDYFFTVIATSDGGYLAGGSFNSTGFNNYNGEAWVVKTDGNGNILWQKKYTDNSNPGRIHGLTQTSDGGYAFTGDFPFTPGLAEWLILKTDATGNIQWQKKFGSSNSDDAACVVEDNHGGAGLVVTGNTYSSTGFDADIVKFDLTTGNVLWTKTYDFDNRTNRFGRISKLSDGFLISAVNHDGFGVDNAVKMLVKTDFNGNVVMSKEFRFPGAATQDGHIAILPDGGFMIGLHDLPESANLDIHLIRLDAAANILWTKKYPRANAQILNGLLSDGNVVVGVGYTKNGSYNDVMLFKSDLSGKMGTCSSVNEIGTSRTSVMTILNSPFSVDANPNLLTINTSSTAVNFSAATNVLCIDSCGPPPPQVSIANVTVNENAGNAVLQVCLSTTTTQSVTVQFATANGSALAGSDYTTTASTVTIPAGQTCSSISIPIINDAAAESSENFTVSLSNPTNATIGNGTATVTINDDDQSQFNCNNVTFTPGNNLITISGVTAPIATIQVFNSSWATVFNQSYSNSPGIVNIPIGPGDYHVKVTFYTSGWSFICDKNQDVTVINQCPPGATCISNICPAQSVNLNNAYSIPNLPSGTVVSWHTGTPATDANRLTPAQAQNVTTSGTYYAAINISGANCYSNTIPIIVTITACNGSSANVSLQVKSTEMKESNKITAFPNPFTHSVRVIIPSTRTEKVTVDLVDMLGRSLKVMPVQLVPGSNQVLLDGLEKYPSGSYFIRVKLTDRIEMLKVLRQQ